MHWSEYGNTLLANLKTAADEHRLNPSDDEYINDGILYCKKCNTPREAKPFGAPTYFRVLCECQSNERDAIENSERERKMLEYRESVRREGIPIESYRSYRFENDDGKIPKILSACKRYVNHVS